MAIRIIRTDEDPILRKKSRVIEKFDDRLEQLSCDMIETMNAAGGIGLAAPQVGLLKRIVIVLDPSDEDAEPMVLVNPEILLQEGTQCKTEGCLSVTGRSAYVNRPLKVKVRYQDVSGKEHEFEGEGDISRVISHELDHLDGVLFTDKMVREVFGDEDEE